MKLKPKVHQVYKEHEEIKREEIVNLCILGELWVNPRKISVIRDKNIMFNNYAIFILKLNFEESFT